MLRIIAIRSLRRSQTKYLLPRATHLPSLASSLSVLQIRKAHSSPNPSDTGSGTSSNAVQEGKGKSGMVAYVGSAVSGVARGTLDLALNPSRIPGVLKDTWRAIKETGEHYYIGSQLLWREIKLARAIIKRMLQGHSMTRRERNQLIRTAKDMLRLIPFMVFIIVPFMELLLPVALTLFPNMLPSTFTDTLQKEEKLKKELQMRIAIAGFFQETMQTIASEKGEKLQPDDKAGAKAVISFFEKVRLGEELPNDVVIKMARLFQDELTLPNVARPQLVSMCKYMGLTPYGADAFLRFQLRIKLRAIKEDDRRILWEGLDELTIDEIKDACQERGMSAYGLKDVEYKRQLREWLHLSIRKDIPISLLIMSRAFTLHTADTVPSGAQLRDSLSSLDEDLINEVVLAAARPEETQSLDMKARRLESLQFQQELIEEEQEDTEEARTGKKTSTMSGESVLPAEDAGKGTATASSSSSSAGQQNLSLPEVQALSDLVAPVMRERTELSELMEKAKPVVVASGDGTAVTSEDRELARMKGALDAMLGALNTKISTTEVLLAERLKLLDLDMDGELSVVELKTAIAQILKRATTEHEAEELARLLDKDADGKVSVAELLRYVEERRESDEVHELEAQVKK